MPHQSTRERIVQAADRLFYRQGYEHTSFADIAAAVNISRGNFYHHFKTKDDILDAVIARRVVRTRGMLARWEIDGDDPLARVRSFINILLANRRAIKRHGCPVGTLSSELAKLNHDARGDANTLFTLFRQWLGRQFSLAGCGTRADDLAMHVLAMSQGVATLANAFADDAFIEREVARMNVWVAEQVAACG